MAPKRRRWEGAYWPVLALMGAVVIAALALHEFTRYGVRADPSPGHVAASRAGGLGPIVDGRSRPPRASAVRPGTVALTFDDGPDPTWTPRILRVLAAERVPATFFVVGARATRHPELLRREAAAGHEIGNHTFSKADLGTSPRWRTRIELAATQHVIAAATGRSTPLLRPPGTGSISSLDAAGLGALHEAADAGYLTVLADRDADGITGASTEQIVRAATERDRTRTGEAAAGRPGLVIRLHDGGGDRERTVVALGSIIDTLRARGYRFETVSAAGNVRYSPAKGREFGAIGGTALIWAVRLAEVTSSMTRYLTEALLVLIAIRVVMLLTTALIHKRRTRRPWGEPVRDPVTVVIPAYNEEAGIAGTVRSLLASDHPIEIIVVDDGSTDGTADAVERLRASSVRVIRRPNGGKSAAINTGVEAAAHDLIVLIDGDTVVEPSTIRELVQPFADPVIGAVAGNIKVANRRGLLGRSQHVEYVTSCSLDRRMYDVLRSTSTVPGAVGAYRRAAFADAGGVPTDTSAEDTDLTIVVGRVGWRIVYAARAHAWTEAPSTFRQFWLQRHRWNYGTLQALWKHRDSFGRRGRFTMFGAIGMPYMLATSVLMPLLSPIGDLAALYALLSHKPEQALMIFVGPIALQIVVSAVAFVLDGERLRALWIVPFQQILYHQIIYLVTMHSLMTALLGVPLRWHKLRRAGLAEVPAAR